METTENTETVNRNFPVGTPCMCPGDCGCRMPAWMFRPVFCGCKQH